MNIHSHGCVRKRYHRSDFFCSARHIRQLTVSPSICQTECHFNILFEMLISVSSICLHWINDTPWASPSQIDTAISPIQEKVVNSSEDEACSLRTFAANRSPITSSTVADYYKMHSHCRIRILRSCALNIPTDATLIVIGLNSEHSRMQASLPHVDLDDKKCLQLYKKLRSLSDLRLTTLL